MDDVAPVIISVVFFLSIAAVLGVYLFTRHRERMAIIEKGLPPEDIRSLYSRERTGAHPLGSLKWGLVFLFAGLGAAIGVFLNTTNWVADGMIPSLIVLAGGLGLVVFYLIARKQ